MATEKNSESVEETAETKEKEPTLEASTVSVKKGHSGLILFVIIIIAIVAVAGIPQSREKIMNFIQTKQEPIAKTDAKSQKPVDEAEKAQEMAIRLEQLENERDFKREENIVASVEKPVVEADQRFDDLTAQIKELKQQVNLLSIDTSRKIEDVRDSMPKTGLIEDNVRALKAKEETLKAQVVKLTAEVEALERNKADASFVLSLSSRMLSAEQKLAASNAEKERASALLLAIYQMRDAAIRGQKFLIEQQAAVALASFRPALAKQIRPLMPYAESGVWTEQALEQSFNIFADKAVLNEQAIVATDWFHRALNSLRELVIVRRLDAPADDPSAQAILARAGQAVATGDFTVAVLQLKALKGSAAKAMAPWISATEKMLYVRKTINEALSSVLGVIYAEKGE